MPATLPSQAPTSYPSQYPQLEVGLSNRLSSRLTSISSTSAHTSTISSAQNIASHPLDLSWATKLSRAGVLPGIQLQQQQPPSLDQHQKSQHCNDNSVERPKGKELQSSPPLIAHKDVGLDQQLRRAVSERPEYLVQGEEGKHEEIISEDEVSINADGEDEDGGDGDYEYDFEEDGWSEVDAMDNYNNNNNNINNLDGVNDNGDEQDGDAQSQDGEVHGETQQQMKRMVYVSKNWMPGGAMILASHDNNQMDHHTECQQGNDYERGYGGEENGGDDDDDRYGGTIVQVDDEVGGDGNDPHADAPREDYPRYLTPMNGVSVYPDVDEAMSIKYDFANLFHEIPDNDDNNDNTNANVNADVRDNETNGTRQDDQGNQPPTDDTPVSVKQTTDPSAVSPPSSLQQHRPLSAQTNGHLPPRSPASIPPLPNSSRPHSAMKPSKPDSHHLSSPPPPSSTDPASTLPPPSPSSTSAHEPLADTAMFLHNGRIPNPSDFDLNPLLLTAPSPLSKPMDLPSSRHVAPTPTPSDVHFVTKKDERTVDTSNTESSSQQSIDISSTPTMQPHTSDSSDTKTSLPSTSDHPPQPIESKDSSLVSNAQHINPLLDQLLSTPLASLLRPESSLPSSSPPPSLPHPTPLIPPLSSADIKMPPGYRLVKVASVAPSTSTAPTNPSSSSSSPAPSSAHGPLATSTKTVIDTVNSINAANLATANQLRLSSQETNAQAVATDLRRTVLRIVSLLGSRYTNLRVLPEVTHSDETTAANHALLPHDTGNSPSGEGMVSSDPGKAVRDGDVTETTLPLPTPEVEEEEAPVTVTETGVTHFTDLQTTSPQPQGTTTLTRPPQTMSLASPNILGQLGDNPAGGFNQRYVALAPRKVSMRCMTLSPVCGTPPQPSSTTTSSSSSSTQKPSLSTTQAFSTSGSKKKSIKRDTQGGTSNSHLDAPTGETNPTGSSNSVSISPPSSVTSPSSPPSSSPSSSTSSTADQDVDVWSGGRDAYLYIYSSSTLAFKYAIPLPYGVGSCVTAIGATSCTTRIKTKKKVTSGLKHVVWVGTDIGYIVVVNASTYAIMGVFKRKQYVHARTTQTLTSTLLPKQRLPGYQGSGIDDSHQQQISMDATSTQATTTATALASISSKVNPQAITSIACARAGVYVGSADGSITLYAALPVPTTKPGEVTSPQATSPHHHFNFSSTQLASSNPTSPSPSLSPGTAPFLYEGRVRGLYLRHHGPVRSILPLAGGSVVWSAADDGVICVWRPFEAATHSTLQPSFNQTTSLYTPLSVHIASAQQSNNAGSPPSQASSSSSSPTTSSLTASAFPIIRPAFALHGHIGPVTALLNLGKEVWSGGHDGTVRVWNMNTRRCIVVLRPDVPKSSGAVGPPSTSTEAKNVCGLDGVSEGGEQVNINTTTQGASLSSSSSNVSSSSNTTTAAIDQSVSGRSSAICSLSLIAGCVWVGGLRDVVRVIDPRTRSVVKLLGVKNAGSRGLIVSSVSHVRRVVTDTVIAHVSSMGVDSVVGWKITSSAHAVPVHAAPPKSTSSLMTNPVTSAITGGTLNRGLTSRKGQQQLSHAQQTMTKTQLGGTTGGGFLNTTALGGLVSSGLGGVDIESELNVYKEMLSRLQDRFRADRQRMAVMGSYFAAELERLVLILATALTTHDMVGKEWKAKLNQVVDALNELQAKHDAKVKEHEEAIATKDEELRTSRQAKEAVEMELEALKKSMAEALLKKDQEIAEVKARAELAERKVTELANSHEEGSTEEGQSEGMAFTNNDGPVGSITLSPSRSLRTIGQTGGDNRRENNADRVMAELERVKAQLAAAHAELQIARDAGFI